MSHKSVKHVIADSGAFIRNAPLQSIAEKVYTIPDVVKEIKDKATLQRLQFLPYKIEYRTPSQESIAFVSNFSKKTGDFKSLSAVDMKLLALTYQLEKEFVGTEHIRTAPERKVEWNSTTKSLEKPTDIAGFYVSKNKSTSRTTSVSDSVEESCDKTEKEVKTDIPECDSNENQTEKLLQNFTVEVEDSVKTDTESNTDIAENKNKFPKEGEIVLETVFKEDFDSDESEEDSAEDDCDDDDDDDDDEDGWITPSNIKDVKQKMGEVPAEEADVMVGCLTMDFAMQNVLLQMGLNVISVDGMLIKRAKSYVLRCFACMKVTSNVLKEFCPFCGNNTLQKVSMTVEEDGSIRYYLSKRKQINTRGLKEDGSIQYYLSKRKQINTRGLKYSLPLPKGGKHANNPVLCEDQPLPQQRASKKSKQKIDVFDPDYIAGYSPFAVTDITSRASQLGIRSGKGGHFKKRNPNEVRKNCGKRK